MPDEIGWPSAPYVLGKVANAHILKKKSRKCVFLLEELYSATTAKDLTVKNLSILSKGPKPGHKTS